MTVTVLYSTTIILQIHGDKLETLVARFAYICRTDQRHDFVLRETARVALDAANRIYPETTTKPTIDEIITFILHRAE